MNKKNSKIKPKPNGSQKNITLLGRFVQRLKNASNPDIVITEKKENREEQKDFRR